MLDHKEIPWLVTKNFETISHVKGYHEYKAIWIPVIGECLLSEREPDNPENKYAVCVKKEKGIVGHLPHGKSANFGKTIFYFLKADELSSCKTVVPGKTLNLEDGDGMQVSCKLIVNVYCSQEMY